MDLAPIEGKKKRKAGDPYGAHDFIPKGEVLMLDPEKNKTARKLVDCGHVLDPSKAKPDPLKIMKETTEEDLLNAETAELLAHLIQSGRYDGKAPIDKLSKKQIVAELCKIHKIEQTA